MPTCGACGEEVPARFRFCGACGSPLAEQQVTSREVRKTVTVLFCDVVDSTRLGSRLDPESLRQVMSRYFDVARAVLHRHGGTVEKFIGDAVMGVFGIPTLHEDDALRAVRAAAELRDAVQELNGTLSRQWGVELGLHMGVNTGQVIAGDAPGEQTLVTGDAVNIAARLEQVAGPDEILIGPITWSLVRDAVVTEPVPLLQLKGKDSPTEARRLVSVIPRASGRARRLDTPMVGRTRERQLLVQSYERAVAENSCHLFTVLGAAGAGKSRLVHQFVTEISNRATVVQGRCPDYGEGVTFWPIVEIARQAAGVGEDANAEQLRSALDDVLGEEPRAMAAADTVAALAGSAETASRADEVPWAVRILFESMARTRPLVVVLDDLHWAEPTLLDLVEHVADWSRDAPILLLCVARQELLDARPGWGGGKFNATSILLEPLSDVDSAVLIGNLLGEISDGESVRSRIVRAAEGNPLFVEELAAMLIDDGVLIRRGDRWEAASDLDAVSIPPTISALLAARLDRLADQERAVIERASVVGASFYRNAVAELSLPTSGPQVAAHLMALVRKELIRPERSTSAGDDAFHFRHLLIRDAAYAALPKRERAELHERFADWLSSAAGGEVHQYDEIIGHHLEQACRQRGELGMHDERQQRLALRAARHLSSAGRRALSLEDAPAAAGLLERAIRVAPATERPELAADLVDALIVQGRLDDARRVLDEHDSGTQAEGAAALALARVHLQIETSGALPPNLASELEVLTERLAGGARQHRVRALLLSATASWLQGCVRRAEQLTREALTEARAGGDRRQRSHALTELAFYAVIGPTPVDEALDLCRQLLDEAQDDAPMRAALLRSAGDLHAMRGEFEQSRRLGEESRRLYEELGLKLAAAQASVDFAMIELEAGDPLAAEAMARAGFEVLHAIGERAYLSSCAAMLAEALHAQGLNHEATRFVEIAERDAHRSDVIGEAQWRSVKAKVLAATGRTEEAVRLAQDSVDQLAGTDLDVFKGGALVALGEVLRAAGRVGESAAAWEEARALYERKGALVMRDHARALLMELADDNLAQV